MADLKPVNTTPEPAPEPTQPLTQKQVDAAEAEVELAYKVLTPELLELRTLAISRFWPLVGLLALATGSMGAAFLQFLNTGFSKSGDLALFVGGGSVVTSLGALLAKSVYGPLSDKIGRKWLILFHYLFEILCCGMLMWKATPATVIVYIIINALTGTYFLLKSVIVDISSHKNEIAELTGKYYAMFGVGAFFTFPLCLVLPQQTGYAISLVLNTLFMLYGALFFPETLPLAQAVATPGRDSTLSMIEYNPVVLLSILGTNTMTNFCTGAWTFQQIAYAGVWTLITPYTSERFGWGATEQGTFIMVSATLGLICNLLIKFLQIRVGTAWILLAGSVGQVAGTAFIACAFHGYDFVMYMSLLSLVPFGYVYGTVLTGVMSSELPKNRQGHLQGAIDSLTSLCTAVGSLVMSGLFYGLIADDDVYFPQGPITVSTILMAVSLYYTWRVTENLDEEQIIQQMMPEGAEGHVSQSTPLVAKSDKAEDVN